MSGGLSEYFPTDRPSTPAQQREGVPDDRPSRPLATPRDPTRVTRPTDSPPPLSPPPGWVGPPDRPTLSEAAPGRRLNFQLRSPEMDRGPCSVPRASAPLVPLPSTASRPTTRAAPSLWQVLGLPREASRCSSARRQPHRARGGTRFLLYTRAQRTWPVQQSTCEGTAAPRLQTGCCVARLQPSPPRQTVTHLVGLSLPASSNAFSHGRLTFSLASRRRR